MSYPDDASVERQHDAEQAWYRSPEGLRWQIREWHQTAPLCGLGGCGSCEDGPCRGRRTCTCVGGPDACAAYSPA